MKPRMGRRCGVTKRGFGALAIGAVVAGCGVLTPSASLVASRTVVAASCAAVSPRQQFSEARLVLLGRMLPGPSTSMNGRPVLGSPARVRVLRYLKGSGPKTVRVVTAVTITGNGLSVAEDGIEPQAGEIWKLYTQSRHQPFETSMCGGSVSMSTGQTALELWHGFPARARRRPVIALGEGVVLDPPTGFPNDETKVAYSEGRFVLRAPVPAGPATVGRWQISSPADAFARLRATERARGPEMPALVIRRVQLSTATFLTDRGRQRLPAWQFSFKDVARPASVLALAAPYLFMPPPLLQLGPPGPGNSIEDSARSNPTGTAIAISFVGDPAGNGPCDASYSASAVANRRAVAFTITAHAPAASSPTVCAGVGYMRTAILHLTKPLGRRVLISSTDGGAVPVTP